MLARTSHVKCSSWSLSLALRDVCVRYWYRIIESSRRVGNSSLGWTRRVLYVYTRERQLKVECVCCKNSSISIHSSRVQNIWSSNRYLKSSVSLNRREPSIVSLGHRWINAIDSEGRSWAPRSIDETSVSSACGRVRNGHLSEIYRSLINTRKIERTSVPSGWYICDLHIKQG